jgi:phosphoribosyl 1,2-cyclic phosphodiesterase
MDWETAKSMNNGNQFSVRFWGVRGAIPTPLPGNMGYGGNTTCLEIRTPDGVIIIDGGSGLRGLGGSLAQEYAGQNLSLNILMTHFHWDHIQGIPFFAPLYLAQNEVTFWSDRTVDVLKETLEGQMTSPYFPVPFARVPGRRNFGRIGDNETFGKVTVRPFALHHPQGASGYRFEHEGKVIVHACDHEQGDAKHDRIVAEYAQGADLLIIDAQYTPEQYEQKRGWGHSTWKYAVDMAREAGVKRLVLSHHDPAHDDAFIDAVVVEARKHFPNTEAAKESSSISV